MENCCIGQTGSPSIHAERCIAELQRGRPVVLTHTTRDNPHSANALHLIQLVETMSDEQLEQLMLSYTCRLVLSRPRAHALDLMVDSSAICLELAPHTPVQTIRDWAGLRPEATNTDTSLASTRLGGTTDTNNQCSVDKPNTVKLQCARAALNLAHNAHVLPAFIMFPIASVPNDVLSVDVIEATNHREQSGELIMLSKARIPLAAAESVELTVFRERHGNAEHVAIKVGDPDLSGTVTVRIHSSCFTGDILGSMKCDCGEQLNRAISTMAEGDGGVVVYVSQEGRGIGLSAKLLAYQLQDKGLDTIEANQHLGFDADERQYQAAVFMLQQLDIKSVRLMTNNPLKIEALKNHGVNVADRVPSPATVNVHNARYLQTKRDRAGHLAT